MDTEKLNKILPYPWTYSYLQKLNFDDSPTTYIMLARMLRKVNELVAQGNNLQSIMEKLVEWIQDNLSEFVTTQLTEWLNDGTLEKIINDALFKSKIGHYPNVATLIADTEITEGNVVQTTGYNAINDGGGAIYQISSTPVTNTVNVELSNGLYAAMIISDGMINIKSIGVIENTSFDLTTYSKFIDTFYIPKGNYILTGTITNSIALESDWATLDLNINIQGAESVVMRKFKVSHGDYTSRIIEKNVGQVLMTNCKNVTISDIEVLSNTTDWTFRTLGCHNIKVTNIYSYGTLSSVVFIGENCGSISVDNMVVHNAIIPSDAMRTYSYGFCTGYTSYTARVEQFKNLTVNNYESYNCEWEGFDCHGGENILLNNLKIFNSPRSITCYKDSRPQYVNEFEMNVTINNLQIENEVQYGGTDNAGLYFYGNADFHVDNLTIENAIFKNLNLAPNGITANYANIHMRNCDFTQTDYNKTFLVLYWCDVRLENVNFSNSVTPCKLTACVGKVNAFNNNNGIISPSSVNSYIVTDQNLFYTALTANQLLIRPYTLLVERGSAYKANYSSLNGYTALYDNPKTFSCTTTDGITLTSTSDIYIPKGARIAVNGVDSTRVVIKAERNKLVLNSAIKQTGSITVNVTKGALENITR